MATQTVEFIAPSGETLTAKLFAAGSDTQVDSASSTEATNRKGTYSVAYTDVAAGTYRLIALNGSSVPLASWWVKLTLTTATFQAYEVPDPATATAQLTSTDIETAVSQVVVVDTPLATSTQAVAIAGQITTAQADLNIITGTNGVLIDDNAITASKYDESTAFPITAADTGSTQIFRTGADSDTGETLSDEIAALQTSVDGIQSGPFVLLDTTVSSVTTATSFVLAGGLATDDYYNGRKVIIVNNDDGTVRFEDEVSDYVGSSKTLTVGSTPSFTVAAGDRVYVLSMTYFDPDTDAVIVGSFNSSALSSLANSEIEVVGVMLPGGVIRLKKGDDYISGQVFFEEKSGENWPDLTGATATLEAVSVDESDPENPAGATIDIAGTVTVATGSSKKVVFNTMTKTVTNIAEGNYDYDFRVVLDNEDNEVRTLRSGAGKLIIDERYVVPDA